MKMASFTPSRFGALLAVALVLLLTAAGCGSLGGGGETTPSQAAQGPPAQAVEFAAAEKGDITKKVTITGSVLPFAEVNVVSSMPGKLAQVLVQVGERVADGQVLARLDSADIEARLKQAEAAVATAQTGLAASPPRVAQAEAGLAQAQAAYDTARANLDRMQSLFDQGAVSQAQLEQASLGFRQAEAGLAVARQNLRQAGVGEDTARAQLAQAQAGLEQARVALNNTEIRAPLGGEVSARFVDPGEMAQGPILTVVSLDRVYVEVGLTENDVNYVRPGQEVAVSVAAASFQGEGRVSSVSPAADPRARTYTARVALANPEGRLKAGMSAAVELATETQRDVVLIPKEAVVSREGQQLVFTVKDGKAVSVAVELGPEDSRKVVVLRGLASGAPVVVKGQAYLQDGLPVVVQSPGGPSAGGSGGQGR